MFKSFSVKLRSFYCFSIIFLFLGLAFINSVHAENHKPLIAITQIVPHDSLNQVRKGIVDGLAQAGFVDGRSSKIITNHAQGNFAMAAQIAQQLVALKPNVIVAIATPSAQTVQRATKHSKIPMVFASITNPVEAQLVSNPNKPDKNATGTRNFTPMDQEFKLIKTLVPKAKTIGIIFNPGEANSVELVKLAEQEAKVQHLRIHTMPVTTITEVSFATTQLVGKVDALFLLQDNFVASALPALLKVAEKNQLPVFSSYREGVKKGAVAGLAFDEYAIGLQTARLVADILKGAKPADLAIQNPEKIELTINLSTAKKLHITISDTLLKQADTIYS